MSLAEALKKDRENQKSEAAEAANLLMSLNTLSLDELSSKM
jgi:hypothetical protein